MTFDKMNLIAPLLNAVTKSGYEEPTPIQQATIPLVLQGKDVLGCAQTGTGKTAAFALPILQMLSKNMPERAPGFRRRPIRALVLTPTRELAQQIYENFVGYGRKLRLNTCVIFGGVKQYSQVEQLRRGVDILVATPGRLCDLIGQGHISLNNIEIFVLDEADRMLDMGFIHDVRRVQELLPKKRQTLLFSATMPEEVESLALSMLTNPETVKVDPPSSTVDTINQSLYYVDKINKRLLLADILRREDVTSALVFTRTRHGADRVVRELEKMNIWSKAIHGDKSQGARQEALNLFKSGRLKVLIATDIAARGIDVAGLSHVINYDLPNEPEAYVHRIGRTGRAGHEGDAISFCCIDEKKQLAGIEKLIHRRIPTLKSPWPMEVLTPTEPKPRGPRPAKLGMDGNPLRERNNRSRWNNNAPAKNSDAQANGAKRGGMPTPSRSAMPGRAPADGRRDNRRDDRRDNYNAQAAGARKRSRYAQGRGRVES